MGRVINPDSTGKTRNQLMRTCAELLRHLSQKQQPDADAKDMASSLVFCLREIDSGIEQSAQAWEKRDYWMKADELRMRWTWAGMTADQLAGIILNDEWDKLPEVMIRLLPKFNDIKITKFTRSESFWQGSYARLLDEKSKT
jgi:hypothetical protein